MKILQIHSRYDLKGSTYGRTAGRGAVERVGVAFGVLGGGKGEAGSKGVAAAAAS